MKTLLLLPILFLVSCLPDKKPIETHHKNNYKLELLFEHDGCKMYRFEDYHTVYWCNCEGRISLDYTTRSGKTSTTHHEETVITK